MTVTLSGTPAFSTAFATADIGGLTVPAGSTFSGSASAGTKKYNITSMGMVFAAGVTLPGGTAGTATSPGAYV